MIQNPTPTTIKCSECGAELDYNHVQSVELFVVQSQRRKQMVEVNVNYSLFSTDDGEYFTGSGQWAIEDFADFIASTLKDSLIVLLHENPYKVFSLIIDSEKAEIEIHQSKAKEAVEVPDIKLLKMLKALDNPIRLEIVNFILSQRGKENGKSGT